MGELSACGFERLVVVARGIDAERFDPRHRCMALRQRWGLSPDDFAVLYVGRLAAEKISNSSPRPLKPLQW